MFNSDQDSDQDNSVTNIQNKLLQFCIEPRSRDEMQTYIAVTSRPCFRQHYLKPLLASGKLTRTIPDKPSSRNQKYITVQNK